MQAKHRTILIAVLTAALVLVVGIGYALAQATTETQTTTDQGQQVAPAEGTGPFWDGFGRGCFRRGHMIGGEVTQVENNTITLKTESGEEKAVKVNDQTSYVKKDGNGSLDDVKPGEKVAVVLAKNQEGTDELIAKVVLIGIPDNGAGKQRPIVGELSAIGSDGTLTIKTPEGDKQVKLPELTQGMRIGVITGPDGQVRGVLYNPPQHPQQPQPEPAPAAEQGA